MRLDVRAVGVGILVVVWALGVNPVPMSDAGSSVVNIFVIMFLDVTDISVSGSLAEDGTAGLTSPQTSISIKQKFKI